MRSQRTARPVQRRGAIVVAPGPACLTESFDGGSYPIGPDIAWGDTANWSYAEAYHFAGSSFEGDGADPTERTLHIVSGGATLRAADPSHQVGPPPTPPIFLTRGWDLGWRSIMGRARTGTDLASTDVTVTATIGAVLPDFRSEFDLVVRSVADYVNDDFPGDYYAGYIVLFQDEYVEIDFQYVSPNFSGDLGFAFIKSSDFPDWSVDLAPGDVLSVTITGTGASTNIVAQVNGATAVEANAAEIEAAMYGTDTIANAPVGLRHGFGLQGFGNEDPSVTVTESFNKADGDPVGPDLSWSSMLPGGHDTIASNALALDASNARCAVVSTTDHPHVRYAGLSMSATMAGLGSTPLVVGTRFTLLTNVSGTSYTDWVGIGAQFTYVGVGGGGGQVWNILWGELNPGDATGALINTYGPGDVDMSGKFYGAIGSGTRVDWILWASPIDGSGIGMFNSTIRLNGLFDTFGTGDGLGPTENINHTTTTAGADHHFGVLLFAPTGATTFQRPGVDTLSVTKPGFQFWDAGTQDDVLSLVSWEVCAG